jgi:hypothetical protein
LNRNRKKNNKGGFSSTHTITSIFCRWSFFTCHTCQRKLLYLVKSHFSLRSAVADYAIFLMTLYDIIFQWWSYTHNSQNVCWTWFFFKIIESIIPTTLMSWNSLTRACYVGCIARCRP